MVADHTNHTDGDLLFKCMLKIKNAFLDDWDDCCVVVWSFALSYEYVFGIILV